MFYRIKMKQISTTAAAQSKLQQINKITLNNSVFILSLHQGNLSGTPQDI